MNMNDEYDADEILRENDDYDVLENDEEIDELDFENDRRKAYDEIVGDMEDPSDLLD